MRSLRAALAVVAVALGATAFAGLFRAAMGLALRHVYAAPDLVAAFGALPAAARVALPAAGGLVAAWVAGFAARHRSAHGVGGVMEAVVLGTSRISLRASLLKALACWCAMIAGGSIGREGPIIQVGAAVGGGVAERLRLPAPGGRVLLAAGTAAGFAAAYNTPFAAVLFVIEVVAGVASLEIVAPVALATAVATTAARALVGGGPIYGSRAFTMTSHVELAAYAALGVAAALVGVGFVTILGAAERACARVAAPAWAKGAFGGAVVGALAVGLPGVVGNGFEPVNAILDGRIGAPGLLLVLLGAKVLATTACVASGTPGGVFTPTLLVGATLGASLDLALRALAPAFPHPAPGAYALVGMAAACAAVTHAPLMASVLVFELSGDYAIVLPVLVATAVAAQLARGLRRRSLYEEELRRRGIEWELTLSGREVRARPGEAPPAEPRAP